MISCSLCDRAGLGWLQKPPGAMGVLPEPCAHRVRTVRPFAYSVSGRSTLPESELLWLVAGLPVYYHRSNGDRVSATVVDPSSRLAPRLYSVQIGW